MSRNILAALSALLVAGMVAIGILVALRAPANLQLPIHWGLTGEPDGYASKWVALLSPAAVVAGTGLFFWFLPALEPRGRNLARSHGLYLAGWAALLVVMVAVEVVSLSAALHWSLRVFAIMTAATGVTFIVIGNQLGKSRSMYLIGIRTPWTLASEEVWIKTHRLAGKLMVGGGLLLAAAALLPLPSGLIATVMGAVVAISVVIPIVYSFLLYRRERGAGHTSG
jgi:uncharacterized membrane protein